MSRRSVHLLACLTVGVGLALPACGSDGDADGTVDITLQEFAVIPSATSAPAGSITFAASNEGPDDDHELVVIRTDLSQEALPTNDDGSANEEGEGVVAIDEIPEFAPGEAQSLTLDLAAGAYVLICNVYDPAEQEAHYQEGMRVAFTVT